MGLADHARRYAELGWSLVSLDGKVPQGYGWQTSLPLPPDDVERIWASREGNMGLVLGPSGVIDFELDSGDEDLFWDLAKTEDPTPIFFTGRAKPHVLFRDPGGLSRRTRDGLELRAGPHQSVIPPSVHPETGQQYEWLNSPMEYQLQPPPKRLLDFFASSNNGSGEGHWRGPLTLGKKLSEGEGRHHSLISFCGRMKHACETPGQLVEAAMVYSEMYHNPPYPESHIEKTALYAWDNYREEQAADPELAIEYLHIERADNIQMKSVEFLWEPFIQKSALHLMVGRKGVGKGTLLAWLAAQMTTGNVFGPARQVLWVSGEDSFEIDVLPRFKAQGGDESRLLAARQKVIFPRDLPALRAVCENDNVGLVILDPIVSVIGRANANDEAAIYEAIGSLNELSDRLDTAVIGVRHIGKNTEYDSLEGVLGSVAWVNIPRAVLNVAQTQDRIPFGGISKQVILSILASNRVREGSTAWFELNETTVDGVNKPVPKVVPANGVVS